MTDTPEIGTNIRTVCGNGRITYRPDWSPAQPWASYWRGSAGRHFVTVVQAADYFRRKYGTRFEKSQPDQVVSP